MVGVLFVAVGRPPEGDVVAGAVAGGSGPGDPVTEAAQVVGAVRVGVGLDAVVRVGVSVAWQETSTSVASVP
ncbi:hypothetical protein [Actinophytocola gossypii]|uniref:Uncharacterized protein n=1 Tax=Actinophytocola gossypii TaxID=2812003 RepID=A0ABT2J2U7_9PSEU|nr:hypothetical protein [Actinophytocola gossypii]MCT2582180.1 hypothetical protein [Actinophytocola gossypii]